MNRNIRVILGLVLAVILVAPACAPSPTPAPVVAPKATEAVVMTPLKFGVMFPFTGDNAAYGKNYRDGIELARKDINDGGGILGRPLEFVYRDAKGDPKEAAAIAQEFCQDREIQFVLGTWSSSEASAAMPIFDECQKIMLSPGATATNLTKDFKYFFRNIVPNAVNFGTSARFWLTEWNAKRPAIIHMQTQYGVDGKGFFMDVLKEKGLEAIDVEAYDPALVDFKAIIAKLKDKNPDVVLMASFYNDAGLFVQQSRDAGFNPKFAGIGGIVNDGFIKVAGQAANGVGAVSGFWPTDPRPEVQTFVKEMNAMYGYTPFSQEPALGYEATMLYADAIKRANAFDAKTVLPVLAATKDFPGVTGTLTFGSNREPNKIMVPILVVDGKFSYYQKK